MAYENDPEIIRKAQKYIDAALAMGAADCVVFEAPQIAWDSRTLLKCMYGCTDWGTGLTCPSRPNYPSMAEMKEMFSRYRWGIIIHAKDAKTSQRISFAMESAAFHDGYYFALSLSDCALCARCAGKDGQPCRNQVMARPAFHSVGIDVFKTVHDLGLPLFPLASREDEDQNWYSAVFIE